MNLARFFSEDMIKLEMTTVIEPLGENESVTKWRQRGKELILEELLNLLETHNRIGNRNKLMLDFINREKQYTTGIGHGVAIPHIRSKQAKAFMIAFARSSQGYDFDAIDKKPAHLFFIMASPPYDDDLYLKVFKQLAGMMQYESFRKELMEYETPGEIIRAIRAME